FLADPTAGEVRIGTGAFLAASFVSVVVDRLSRRYPRIVFQLLITQGDALGHELSERNVDLVIATLRGGVTDEKLSLEVLYADSSVDRGWRAKPMGSPAEHRFSRSAERFVGAAAAATRVRAPFYGSLSLQRAALSSRNCVHYFPRGADQSCSDRPLSFDCPYFCIEIS